MNACVRLKDHNSYESIHPTMPKVVDGPKFTVLKLAGGTLNAKAKLSDGLQPSAFSECVMLPGWIKYAFVAGAISFCGSAILSAFGAACNIKPLFWPTLAMMMLGIGAMSISMNGTKQHAAQAESTTDATDR